MIIKIKKKWEKVDYNEETSASAYAGAEWNKNQFKKMKSIKNVDLKWT